MEIDLVVDSEQRQALVFAPSGGTAPHPLVLAFHGHGGTMTSAAATMHIETLWPEAVVVYPQGLAGRPSPVDPAGHNTGWQVVADQAAGNVGNKDLDFFDALLAKVEDSFVIDPRRVYASGFSNGAIFSYLLWAHRAPKLAAIGECAGRLMEPETFDAISPRPLAAVAGILDTTDPFDKQMASLHGAGVLNQIAGAQAPVGTHCMLYPSAVKAPIKVCIHDGSHIYPAWASDGLVSFFKNHALP
jgi:polyhydroxybutyrate depolymerase